MPPEDDSNRGVHIQAGLSAVTKLDGCSAQLLRCYAQSRLQSTQTLLILQFPAFHVGDVEGVDSCPFLSRDARKRDMSTGAPDRTQQRVEQPEPVRRLDINQRVGWVFIVIDGDPGREI